MTSKSIFKLTFVALAAGASLSAFAQYNPNIQQNFQPNQSAGFQDWQNGMSGAAAASAATAAASYQNPSAQFLQSSAPANTFGQSGSGYTNDGTLFMGGQRIGNPHQILHDAEVPSLIGITAVRYSFTDVPTYGQGTLAQIQTDMANAPITNDPTRMFSRLYLTTANPYTQGVATPHNNYQTYEGILTSASAASYQLTAADDGKMYAFKTLSAPNQQSMNILIKELPNTSQFKGSTDLKGGATGVHVTQNGDAAALSAYMATLKPYDFSWRAALAPYANDPNTGAFVANWVMGSHQVQAYQLGMQNQSMQTGNEAFGVLAWDANQNKYVMLDPTNMQATAGSVSGNMPTLGNNQFGFFGMHTHPGSATPSGQDYAMTQQLGLDQLVVGTNGATAIMTNNPSNNWQGKGFEFEDFNAGKPRKDQRVTITITGGGEATYGLGGKVTAGTYVTFDGNGNIVDQGVVASGSVTGGYQAKGAGTVVGITEGPADTLGGLGWSLSGTYGLATVGVGGSFGDITTIEAGAAVGYGGSVAIGYTSTKSYDSISTDAKSAAQKAYDTYKSYGGSGQTSGSSNYATQATYNSTTGDSNHAPGTSYSSHVNGF